MMKKQFQCLFGFSMMVAFIQPGKGVGQSMLKPTVIATAGTVSNTPTFQLEWTLGESFVSQVQSNTGRWTEGFHQPSLLVVAEKRKNPDGLKVMIYPNPAKELIQVDIQSSLPGTLILKLIDVTGKTVLEKETQSGSQTIPVEVSLLPEGMYLLTILTHDGQWMKTYKMIKH